MTRSEALVALNLIPGVGSHRLKSLLEEFEDAPRIFLSPASRLRRASGIGGKLASAISAFDFDELKKELELCDSLGVRIITINDAEYPENLKQIYDPPICLYVKGSFLPDDNLSLAVVGSRRASYYGLSCAERFSYQLSGLGITIVSGMARGVDTQAHKGAMKAKGRTIAVLGSGLNRIYPPENKAMAEEIAASGAVVSEFPLNTPPQPQNFPRRNRVISGLALAVVVVEAARNSGALITSDFALEQGRDVFAIPGKIDSANSYGTNQLIKQGAKLVDSVEDILQELKPEIESLLKPRSAFGTVTAAASEGNRAYGLPKPRLNEEEELVYSILDSQPRYADEIIEATCLPGAKVMSVLLKLEMGSIIKQLPGKLFVRKGV